jgi:hypothetical protein
MRKAKTRLKNKNSIYYENVYSKTDLHLKACAKYILWQTPVAGFAEINVNLIDSSRRSYESAVTIHEQKMLSADGCVDFDISVSLMIQAERLLWAKQFNISLEIEEDGTGVVQQQQRVIDLSTSPYEISFENYRDTFKFKDTRPYTTDVIVKSLGRQKLGRRGPGVGVCL